MTEAATDSGAPASDPVIVKERFRRLGDVVIDREKRCVFRDGEATKLEPRVFALLDYFLEHPGREVSRQELAAQVWNGTNVVDEAIQRAISVLRAALGDTPKQGLHIQTTAGGGYRLVSEVGALRAQSDRPTSWRNLALAAAAGILVGAVAMAWFNESRAHYAPEAPIPAHSQKPSSLAPRAPGP